MHVCARVCLCAGCSAFCLRPRVLIAHLRAPSPRPLQGCYADPIAELEAWQHSILDSLPASRPTSPPPLQHVSAIIVQLYAHRVRQLPLTGPTEPRWVPLAAVQDRAGACQ